MPVAWHPRDGWLDCSVHVYALYTVVTAVLFVLAAPFFLWKGRGTGKYVRTFRERMNGPLALDAAEGSIWVHAVSVGEVMAVRPLVERLKQRYPHTPLFVSTTTLSLIHISEPTRPY